MIHTCDTMTVRQYAAYEKAHNVKLLYRYFSFLSRFGLFADDLQAFVDEFNRLFNPNADNDLSRQVEKLKYQNTLIIMQALGEAINLHIITRSQMQQMAQVIGYTLPDDKNFAKYLEEIERISGIKIENTADLKAFQDEFTRKLDKFKEIFREKEASKGGGIMELFFACCQILEQSPDYTRMTLAELATFKAQAEVKARRLEEQYAKK